MRCRVEDGRGGVSLSQVGVTGLVETIQKETLVCDRMAGFTKIGIEQMNLDGTDSHRLDPETIGGQPCVGITNSISPDGSMISMCVNTGSSPGVYVMDRHGQSLTRADRLSGSIH